MEVFISKQPILNRHDDIICYELFYRDKQFNELSGFDENQSTIETLINAFLSIGIDRITNNKPCFILFPYSLLMSDFLNSFQHDQLIIEIKPDFVMNETFISRIRELKSDGYNLCISSAILHFPHEQYSQLLQYIDFCTVDFSAFTVFDLKAFEDNVKRYNPQIRLLARNVENRLAFELAKSHGYVMFQGNYFMEPETITTNDIAPQTTHYFELLSMFYDEDPDISEIAETIEQDVSLTYKILQLANNASNQLSNNIISIRQAIMLLGLAELQKWIYLLTMRNNPLQQSDIERALIRSSLLRAKICEQLARNKLISNYSQYYLVGMFSNIDSLLARPMSVIMEQLPFTTLIKQTLLEHNTEVEPFLQLAICLDKLQWDKISTYSLIIGIPIEQVELIFSNAVSWVDAIFDAIDEMSTESFTY